MAWVWPGASSRPHEMRSPSPLVRSSRAHRLERDGWLVGRRGRSESNRKAKLYSLTKAGRQHLARESSMRCSCGR